MTSLEAIYLEIKFYLSLGITFEIFLSLSLMTCSSDHSMYSPTPVTILPTVGINSPTSMRPLEVWVSASIVNLSMSAILDEANKEQRDS